MIFSVTHARYEVLRDEVLVSEYCGTVVNGYASIFLSLLLLLTCYKEKKAFCDFLFVFLTASLTATDLPKRHFS